MKKRYFTALIAAITVLAGCSGFLEENNPTGRKDIYQTEKDLEAAVEGVMAGFLYSNGLNGESTEAYPCASGLIHWSQTTQRLDSDKWRSCLKFTQYSRNDWNGYHFRAMFMVVFRANALINALSSSPVEESYKKEIEAEARFYRAVAYFIAVRKWGDLPIWTTEVNFDNASNQPRQPYYKVYDQIVRDLRFAEQYMRSPERVEQIGAMVVRPNKYAATAFLSSVYVTLGSLLASPDDNFWDSGKEGRSPVFEEKSAIDGENIETAEDAYEEALYYAELLLPESPSRKMECKYDLLEKFGDVFSYDKDFSRNGYTSFKHPEQVFVLPISTGGSASCTYAQYQLPEYPAGTHASVKNEQYGRVRPTRWAFQKWCSTYPGEWRNGNHYEYKNCADPRFEETFYYGNMEYCDGHTWGSSQSNYLIMYPADMSCNLRQNAFAYFRKYASPSYNVTRGDADIYVMRFAEVYLNAVEAAAFLGIDDKVQKYMEVIHARARHSVPDGQADAASPAWDYATVFSDREALMVRIFWERIFEFFGEDKEYYEVHRHGAQWIVDNIVNPKNAFIAQNLENYKSSQNAWNIFMVNFYGGTDFRYSTDVDEMRKSLLCGFPINESLYNFGISGNNLNDYDYAN